MKIAAVIVAAGRSSRFDAGNTPSGNKLLAAMGGKPVIAYVTEAVLAAGLDDVVLVTAPNGGEIREAAGTDVRAIINDRPAEGLSSSIQAGLRHLDPETRGALIVLADMPRIPSTLIAKLCAAFAACGGSKIVFPQTAAGQRGNPVLWPRALFPELMQLSGDVGGKALLAKHPTLLLAVVLDDAGILLDIDTTADLARVASYNT